MQERQLITILASISGKYSATENFALTSSLVNKIYDEHRNLTENQLILAGTPTRDVETDIANQVRCYLLIEKFWRYAGIRTDLVQKLHCAMTGTRFESIQCRDTPTVIDYPGVIPTGVEDVAQGIAEINRRLASVQELSPQSDIEKASCLAELFALIIRVHPFPDGNGRTARAAVQYCLRVWGFDYLIVPKVRNDATWREALACAVNGSYVSLTDYFLSRLSWWNGRSCSD